MVSGSVPGRRARLCGSYALQQCSAVQATSENDTRGEFCSTSPIAPAKGGLAH
ncbi:unnamed protein product [Penicillium roqueforti FM164]|uniref:Genomic scaffold, ProqFM164S03 n=1 Tax=Penicillium roqueforti (strain FM164) TaxID=1365484 RepID=W6QBA8_PENRF|nr:unnamed protein product [Penicillium roqueforti FM164]